MTTAGHTWTDGEVGTGAEEAWRQELAQALPNLGKLIVRTATDSRIPVRSKVVVGAAVALAISPFDLIPDFVPILGKLDDVLLIAYALDRLVKKSGTAVLHEHWDGDPRILAWLLDLIDIVAGMIPRPMRLLLNRYI